MVDFGEFGGGDGGGLLTFFWWEGLGELVWGRLCRGAPGFACLAWVREVRGWMDGQ